MDGIITIDFETHAIQPRPDYPPEPVGVAIYEVGKCCRYLAWGHPAANNCTRAQALQILRPFWREPLLFHNAKFDLDVAEVHLGLKLPRWQRIHDTELLAFLNDPHAKQLALKPLAEHLLKLPPEEQLELREWILTHVPEARRKPKAWGAFIAQAPGDLVGKYARGDVQRTRWLYNHLWPQMDEGLRSAYDRERRLLPVLLRSERQGIRINQRRLARDLCVYEADLGALDKWIQRRLGFSFNIDSSEELAEAIERKGCHDGWILTAKGKRSTARKNLMEVLTDRPLGQALAYRGYLSTCLATFLRPWRERARDNLIYTSWHQVRGATEREQGGRGYGARTGRMSSSNPLNFQNIPKRLEAMPAPIRLHGLPNVRAYILPRSPDEVLIQRDYSQQELRILGYFEGDVLREAYRQNPRLDMHTKAQELINSMLHANFERRPIKNTGFGIIYGMGLKTLCVYVGTDYATAKQLRDAYRSIFPGLKTLEQELRAKARSNEPIRTWGGRRYYVEPPLTATVELFESPTSKRVVGHSTTVVREFAYKLLNYLIQGSAADNTKTALIQASDALGSPFLVAVHDEIIYSVPRDRWQQPMGALREAMHDVDFGEILMLSDGKVSRSRDPSWASMRTSPV